MPGCRLQHQPATSCAAQILPDLREDRWRYNGSATLESGRHRGKAAHAWVWRVTNDEGYGAYHNTYTFYAAEARPCIIYVVAAPFISWSDPQSLSSYIVCEPTSRADRSLQVWCCC